jgi:hypothetical protein
MAVADTSHFQQKRVTHPYVLDFWHRKDLGGVETRDRCNLH